MRQTSLVFCEANAQADGHTFTNKWKTCLIEISNNPFEDTMSYTQFEGIPEGKPRSDRQVSE